MGENSSKKKTLKLVSIIVGFLCVVAIVLGTFKVLAGPFLEMPMFDIFDSLFWGDEKVDEAKGVLTDASENLSDWLDTASDADVAEFEDMVKMDNEDFLEMIENPSLNNLVYISDILAKEKNVVWILESTQEDSALSNSDEKTADDGFFGQVSLSVFSAVRLAILLYAGFLVILALLGALLKNRVFTIIAMFFAIPLSVFMAGWLFAIPYYAFSVAHIILVAKAKHA